MNAADAWSAWADFEHSGSVYGKQKGLDSAEGRVLVGFRLAYLEQEYRATGLAEVAWDAYRLARQQRCALPEWVLVFLDGVAPQQGHMEQDAAGAGPEPAEPRLEFDVAAHAVCLSTFWLRELLSNNPGDDRAAAEVVTTVQEYLADETGRPVSWVRESCLKHQEFVFNAFQLKDKGREFLSAADFAPIGGKASGKTRRSHTRGIDAAISDELGRWKGSDAIPTADRIWNKLSYRYRNAKPVRDLWEVKVDSERITQTHPTTGEEHSIARATFKTHFYKVRKKLAEKV